MTKEQLAQWLVELDENVLQVAIMYAENYLKYGVDIAEKWDTATKQIWSLERAERYGYAEGRKSIVRCKDCVYWDKGHTEQCDNSDSVCFHNGWCQPDWYCADGERR